MESIISKRRIETLKAHTVLRQFHCESLAVELEAAALTISRKPGLAYPWDDMLKETQLCSSCSTSSRDGKGKASQPGKRCARQPDRRPPRRELARRSNPLRGPAVRCSLATCTFSPSLP